jgi:hypothetical protein
VRLGDCSFQSIVEEAQFIRDHIIICGSTRNLFNFLLPLRSQHLKKVPQIVVLGEHPIAGSTWKQLEHFQGIYFVQGSPHKTEDLRAAGVRYASHVVIFAQDYEDEGSQEASVPDDLLDADTIFSYRVIRKESSTISIICELLNQKSIKFIESYCGINNPSQQHHLSIPFAAG